MAAGLSAASLPSARMGLGGSIGLVAEAATRVPPSTLCARLGHAVVQRIWRGYRPGASGQLIMVPAGKNYLSGGITHTTPWLYTSSVPMWWVGPGVIPNRGAVTRPVNLTDVAPTVAALAKFGWRSPDGRVMTETLEKGQHKPRLIVVLVWDGVGQYVLGLAPHAWPNLSRRLAGRQGVWYRRATVGSSPTNTAPAHANLGTGAFPRRHGILDSQIRLPDGSIQNVGQILPQGLREPTLADEYLEATHGEPRVGLLGTLAWHLPLLGHGASGGFSHRPFLTLGGQPVNGSAWGIGGPLSRSFRFPQYINDLPPLASYYRTASQLDGNPDDLFWRGHHIPSLGGGWDTPARIPFQMRSWKEVIVREGFGRAPGRTDVLYLNCKVVDQLGHMFSASSIEVRDGILMLDRHLEDFLGFLDERVGRGLWALCLTADHGHTAAPEVSGGFPINSQSVRTVVNHAFDRDGDGVALVSEVRPSWLYLDRSELHGASLEAVARRVSGLRLSDVVRSGGQSPAFAAAFPGEVLRDLPCL
jgi:hypothetical protein